MVKRLPTMREIRVWSLGLEDPLEKAMAPHSSTLAWRIPWTKPGGLQSMGWQRVRYVFTEVALLISFKNFSFAFTWLTWLTGSRGLAFWLISTFNMPSSLNLTISSFWFKVRGSQLFLSLQCLEYIVALLNDLISVLLCLKEQRCLKIGREMGNSWFSGTVRTHSTCID